MARKRKPVPASKIIKEIGGPTALVREFKAMGDSITRGAIHQWVTKGDLVPVDRCWQVEQALRRKGITKWSRFDMRPAELGPDPRNENREVAAA